MESPEAPLDFSYGGAGNDIIRAKDGNVDYINCGTGRDTVFFDEGTDTVSNNCELRNPAGVAAEERTASSREDQR